MKIKMEIINIKKIRLINTTESCLPPIFFVQTFLFIRLNYGLPIPVAF